MFVTIIFVQDQALQESNVKCELLEKRMENAKKDAEQIHMLEEELDKAQAQAQMYSEAMENLQAEYEALEQENIQLKRAMAARNENKRSSMPKPLTGFDFGGLSSGDQENDDNSHDLHEQVKILSR